MNINGNHSCICRQDKGLSYSVDYRPLVCALRSYCHSVMIALSSEMHKTLLSAYEI